MCPAGLLCVQVKEDGTIDYYPIQFKLYRHTTLPPPLKSSSLPWPLASLFGTLGITSSKQPSPTPLVTGGMAPGGSEDGPVQPPLPRRELYYYAAFTGNTTFKQVWGLFSYTQLMYVHCSLAITIIMCHLCHNESIATFITTCLCRVNHQPQCMYSTLYINPNVCTRIYNVHTLGYNVCTCTLYPNCIHIHTYIIQHTCIYCI